MKVFRFLFSIIFGFCVSDELKDPCSNEGKSVTVRLEIVDSRKNKGLIIPNY